MEQAIGGIRKATADRPQNPRFIRTIKRRGYRFIGIVDTSGAPPQADAFDEWMKGRRSLESLSGNELLCHEDLRTAGGSKFGLFMRTPHQDEPVAAGGLE